MERTPWALLKLSKYLIALCVTLVILACNSYACNCIGENPVKKEIEQSDAVFTGRVIAKTVFAVSDSMLPKGMLVNKAEYTFVISSAYKGRLAGDTIKLITGIGSGDCGFNFKPGIKYIVYAVKEDKYFPAGSVVEKFLHTDICTRTRVFNKGEIKKLKKYTGRA